LPVSFVPPLFWMPLTFGLPPYCLFLLRFCVELSPFSPKLPFSSTEAVWIPMLPLFFSCLPPPSRAEFFSYPSHLHDRLFYPEYFLSSSFPPLVSRFSVPQSCCCFISNRPPFSTLLLHSFLPPNFGFVLCSGFHANLEHPVERSFVDDVVPWFPPPPFLITGPRPSPSSD